MAERLGDYELIRELGAGATGSVFLARHVSLGRQVAIKRIRVTSGQNLARFTNEAQAVARLQHPHIVKLHEAMLDGPEPYLVMSVVEGESLAERLERDGPLERDQVLEITLQLAGALAHAHERGVLHRDIKPANVLLDREGQAYLTDFGLAKDLAESREALTRAGQIVGTPAYMAPEQATGGRIGLPTDVYGLAATLYAMLTGQPPLKRSNLMALVAAITLEPPKPLRELRPDLDRGLEAVVARCLAKAPGDRYPSARELVEDLERVRAGDRPVARPRRWGLWAACAVVLVGAGALAWPAAPIPAPERARASKAPAPTRGAEPRPTVAPTRSIKFWRKPWPVPVDHCRGLVSVGAGRLLAITERRLHGRRIDEIWLVSPERGRPMQRLWSVEGHDAGARTTISRPRREVLVAVDQRILHVGPIGASGQTNLSPAWPTLRSGALGGAGRRDLLFLRDGGVVVGDPGSGAPTSFSVPGLEWRGARARSWLSPSGRFAVLVERSRRLICLDRDRPNARRPFSPIEPRTLRFLPGDEVVVWLSGQVMKLKLPSLKMIATTQLPIRGGRRFGPAALGPQSKTAYFARGSALYHLRLGSLGIERVAGVEGSILDLALDETGTRVYYATEWGVSVYVLGG